MLNSRRPTPNISVIIVSWNSAIYLPRCLSALVAQSYRDFEVLIVDNGSSDNAILNVEDSYPTLDLRVERLEKNTGFAVANNIGARLAQGKWLALLNADAFPEPDCLKQLLQAVDDNPEFTFFASRQIQANTPELLDGTGDAYHVSGLAWRENYNNLASKYGMQSGEVFSACAAAALYLRDDFMKVGGFDEDYFSYHEDVDLGFRLRLTGGRCLYVPQAVVHHVGSASTGKTSDFSYYYGHRNLVWTFFKDMPAVLFWIYLPVHLLMNIYLSASYLFKEKRSIILKSKVDAFRVLPAILRKRKYVQQLRSVSTREIHRVMIKELFAPYLTSQERNKKK
jgi:GT2 family glycosyltransferase